jgi:hypothetical protein
MATKITDSIIIDSNQPSQPFTSLNDFEVICKLGKVVVQTEIDSEWYNVGVLYTKYVSVLLIPQGVSVKVNLIEPGRLYRLLPQDGIATAEAWELA